MALRIPLEPVTSSNLDAIGYDLERSILAVRFKSGSVYHYSTVPAEVAKALFEAESKGTFYATRIKKSYPGYPSERMTAPCPKCGDEGWIGETCDSCGCGDYTPAPRKEKEKENDPQRRDSESGGR